MCVFLNMSVLHGGFVSTSPNPQAEGSPLVGCLGLLIQFIRSYSPYRRPFLYPQPEDMQNRGDRELLHGVYSTPKETIAASIYDISCVGVSAMMLIPQWAIVKAY